LARRPNDSCIACGNNQNPDACELVVPEQGKLPTDTDTALMKPASRVAFAFMVFFGTYVLTWLLALLLPLGSLGWIGNVISLIVAVALARYTWIHADVAAGSLAGAIGYGAILFGGIGFAAGFFGPMIFAPEANQGPLLGILITGPAGVLLGVFASLIYGLARLRRENRR
jgi:hypothetical protein